ncbi:VPLPA-CTERM sorting domain-containing protein [Methylomonas sp. LL1]|uniref:VPLPA-CTERM sorting domain-containing protein n=1 Tax=Methylomonas sp. LL1 TaxID=2785785 RepID=UPI0018C43DDB|nr:VPLPA-CTERM sorting domain-containing protein [Methylomonas sp. LL1]QPK63975.1 VPLPA-CTERM sorting domain-containing protein [Methylomonas sp. LL1]
MKHLFNKQISLGLVLGGISMLNVQAVQAASSFNSFAELTYTITGITNLSSPGVSEEVLGSSLFAGPTFELAVFPDSYVDVTGDGLASVGSPGNAGLQLGSAFRFSTSGSVGNGQVDSSHLGWFSLDFANNTADTYEINVKLDYLLDAGVGGDFAHSSVSIDYFNNDYTFSGYSSIEAGTLPLALTATQSGSSGIFSFTLAPNATELLYADVRITGNLAASPVPLPAAVWMFLAGLMGVLGLNKRKAVTQL